MGSELSGQTPKTSISSGLPSSPIPSLASPEEESELLQLALALLLKVTPTFTCIISQTFLLSTAAIFLSNMAPKTFFSSRADRFPSSFTVSGQPRVECGGKSKEDEAGTNSQRIFCECVSGLFFLDHVLTLLSSPRGRLSPRCVPRCCLSSRRSTTTLHCSEQTPYSTSSSTTCTR